MSTYKRGLDLANMLLERGIAATCDPRGAVPPCVLISPPAVQYAGAGMCTPTASWEVWALASTTGNADAWQQLDDMLDVVADVLPVEAVQFLAYATSPDAAPMPAYRITFTQGVDA